MQTIGVDVLVAIGQGCQLIKECYDQASARMKRMPNEITDLKIQCTQVYVLLSKANQNQQIKISSQLNRSFLSVLNEATDFYKDVADSLQSDLPNRSWWTPWRDVAREMITSKYRSKEVVLKSFEKMIDDLLKIMKLELAISNENAARKLSNAIDSLKDCVINDWSGVIPNHDAISFWDKYVSKPSASLDFVKNCLRILFEDQDSPQVDEILNEIGKKLDRDGNGDITVYEYGRFTATEDILSVLGSMAKAKGLRLKRLEDQGTGFPRPNTTYKITRENAGSLLTKFYLLPEGQIRGDGEEEEAPHSEFVWSLGFYEELTRTLYLEQEFAPNRVIVYRGKKKLSNDNIDGVWFVKNEETLTGAFEMSQLA